MLFERGAVPLARDLPRIGQQRLERAVRLEQLARALLADAGHALDVVDGVAHERQHVDHLVRRDAELRPHPFGVEPGALVARIEHPDPVADELVEVLVAGDDRDVAAGGPGLLGQRADDVVRLELVVGQNRHAQRLARLVHGGHLRGQVVRHRGPVGLVFRIETGPERRSPGVERGGDEIRIVVRHELPEHVDEAVHGVRRPAIGAGQFADGVIGAVELRAAVDEIETPAARPRPGGGITRHGHRGLARSSGSGPPGRLRALDEAEPVAVRQHADAPEPLRPECGHGTAARVLPIECPA